MEAGHDSQHPSNFIVLQANCAFFIPVELFVDLAPDHSGYGFDLLPGQSLVLHSRKEGAVAVFTLLHVQTGLEFEVLLTERR
jgi:hypothetical protein